VLNNPATAPRRRKAEGENMKRIPKKLATAVWWIAHNDSAGDPDALDPEVVSGYLTVVMAADIFGQNAGNLGALVVELRKACTCPACRVQK
jgi:hypothetical protein